MSRFFEVVTLDNDRVSINVDHVVAIKNNGALSDIFVSGIADPFQTQHDYEMVKLTIKSLIEGSIPAVGIPIPSGTVTT